LFSIGCRQENAIGANFRAAAGSERRISLWIGAEQIFCAGGIPRL
jgi:hypothetical protein